MPRKPREGESLEPNFSEGDSELSLETYRSMIENAESRMSPLVEKEQAGALSAEERAELASIRHLILRIESLPGYYAAALAEKVNKGPDVVLESREQAEAKAEVLENLQNLVLGQSEATQKVGNFIHNLKSSSTNPDVKTALGSFFFVGPSGVGKDKTVEAFIETLTGSDFSENQQKIVYVDGNILGDSEQSLNRLIGSATGYVGSVGHAGYQAPLLARLRNDEAKISYPLHNGKITRQLKVVVFREFDNIAQTIQKLLADSIEKGSIEVDQKTLDLTDTVFFFTSNSGNYEAERLRNLAVNQEGGKVAARLRQQLRDCYATAVSRNFNPEFVGKISGGFTVFDHLDPELVRTKIIDLLIQNLVGLRIAALSEYFRNYLAGMYNISLGVRPIKNFIVNNVDPEVVRLAQGMSQKAKKGDFMLDLAYGEHDASGAPKIILRKIAIDAKEEQSES